MHSGIYTTTSSTSTPSSPPPPPPPPRAKAVWNKQSINNNSLVTVAFSLFFLSLFDTAKAGSYILNYDPAPPADEGPAASRNAVRDTAYLPAQIGGIVGAYALSLVLVAAALLLLSKRRRDHINGIDAPRPEYDLEFQAPQFTFPLPNGHEGKESKFPYPVQTPHDPVPNFSYPSPLKTDFPRIEPLNPWVDPASPQSRTSACAPGVDIHVDQQVVRQDRQMAQSQLEDMYRYVMEQEEAKEKGLVLQGPVLLPDPRAADTRSFKSAASSKRGRNKPAGLILHQEEKKESRTSSFFNALRSPRGKKAPPRGISISSPMMTPMSATFPRFDEGEEMDSITPRQYVPPPPPPVPTEQATHGGASKAATVGPITPDHSPESTMSIDERLRGQLPLREQGESSGHNNNHNPSHSRNTSTVQSEQDQPISAVSERSNTPLVGLPTSPKPGVTRFPSLPLSPKPGQSFPRSNAPTAVRTGGALPLRAYEPSITSPSMSSFQTKQTVFERPGPLSPGGMRTPFTGVPVPYSPYQPQTPCVPMTPSLVTKKDRKRMKKLEPKTPTVEMVRSSDDIW